MAVKYAKVVIQLLKHATKPKPYRKSRYGITDAEFRQRLLEQDGKCKICGKDDWLPNGPCVDHDHATGNIRGLLCFNCNRGIGAFKDDSALVEKAVKYLLSAK